MKAHRVEVEVTTKYVIEVHGEDEAEVTQTAENMDNTQIEAAGDFVESVKVEVTDIEVMYPDDEEDEEVDEESDGPLQDDRTFPPEPRPTPEETGFVDLDSLKASEGSEESEEESKEGEVNDES